MVRTSAELESDAAAFTPWISAELGFALASFEDETALLADGSPTYAGIQGLNAKILGLAGAVDAATNNDTFAEITATDLATAFAKLPDYAAANAKWFCSQSCFAHVFCRLAAGAGGLTSGRNGVPLWWGMQVVVSPQFPNGTSTTDFSDVPMLYVGDLARACIFGSRRQITVKRTDSRYLEFDQAAYRATERFDIVWVLGTAATAGPLIGLIGD